MMIAWRERYLPVRYQPRPELDPAPFSCSLELGLELRAVSSSRHFSIGRQCRVTQFDFNASLCCSQS